MERLVRLVTNTSTSTPASTASSTAYWMSGLSTMGSISLGEALVAGRKRVPRPATGNTALRMRVLDMVFSLLIVIRRGAGFCLFHDSARTETYALSLHDAHPVR